MKDTPAYYAVIPASVRYDDRLCANAKLLFGEIAALSNREGFCWASNQYFAKLYNVHEKTISEWIGQLVDAKHIDSVVEKNYKRQLTIMEAIGGWSKNTEGVERNPDTPPSGNPDNITLKSNTTMNEKLVKFSFSFEEGFVGIPHEDLVRWKETYPAVHIEGEIKRAAEWLRSNPTKLKSNYRKFLTNWFSRTQDHGGTKGYVPKMNRPAAKIVPETPLTDEERAQNIEFLNKLTGKFKSIRTAPGGERK